MNRIALYTALISVLIGTVGCSSLFRIDLTMVGEKTALERQVLGTYQELGRDLSVYSSVRGVQPDGSLQPPPQTTDSQRAVLQAINNRRYNRDDLDALLNARIVGEANSGMLVRQEQATPPNPNLTPELIEQIIMEENRDREVIIERLMRTTPGVTEAQRAEVAWIFASLNQELAPDGSLVQSRAGEWDTK